MSGLLGFILVLLLVPALLVPGIIFINKGRGKNVAMITIGWCIIGTIATALTFGTGLLFYYWGTTVLTIVMIVSPLIIIAGLIVTVSLGITYLIKGYTRDKDGKINKRQITAGFVLLGINTLILAAIITLAIIFTSGLIPIALM